MIKILMVIAQHKDKKFLLVIFYNYAAPVHVHWTAQLEYLNLFGQKSCGILEHFCLFPCHLVDHGIQRCWTAEMLHCVIVRMMSGTGWSVLCLYVVWLGLSIRCPSDVGQSEAGHSGHTRVMSHLTTKVDTNLRGSQEQLWSTWWLTMT